MKMKLLIISIISFSLFTACNNEEATEEMPEEVEVTFNTALENGSFRESLTKTGTYERGTAPVYLSGIKITANKEGDVTEQTFDFVDFTDSDNNGIHDGGGDPITMNVKLGSNIFTAESVAANTYTPGVMILPNHFSSKLEPNGTLEEKAAAYSARLLTDYPLYAKYSGTATQDILFYGPPVDILLTPQNGRVNIIFETDVQGTYTFVLWIYDSNGNTVGPYTVIHSQTAEISTSDTYASALIVNNDAITDGCTAELYLWTNSGTIRSLIDSQPFSLNAGVNTTRVYRVIDGTTTNSSKSATVFDPVYNMDE